MITSSANLSLEALGADTVIDTEAFASPWKLHLSERIVEPDWRQVQTPLTLLCSTGGCAAKLDAPSLHRLLEQLEVPATPDLLVGLNPADDAAVFRVTDDLALVFTVDFFPPIVDDPYTYGFISANNALNDVYAMGGRPVLALSIAVFPTELPPGVLSDILRGALDACSDAGAALAGGHTIRDDEPRFGLAVAGLANPRCLWLRAGAKPGDELFLTKPLGVGLIVSGKRRGEASQAELDEAIKWMSVSNRGAADVLHRFQPSAVTDITGFGLLGHAWEVAAASNVRLIFDSESLPILRTAERLAGQGLRTSAHTGNQLFVAESLEVADGVRESLLGVALDPQTAGGLLISIPPDRAPDLVIAFKEAQVFCAQVGRVECGTGVAIS